MEEVKMNAGILRFNRNLSLVAMAGCLVTGSLLASGHAAYPLDSVMQSVCGGILDLCAIFPGMIAYENHEQLKKLK